MCGRCGARKTLSRCSCRDFPGTASAPLLAACCEKVTRGALSLVELRATAADAEWQECPLQPGDLQQVEAGDGQRMTPSVKAPSVKAPRTGSALTAVDEHATAPS